MKRLLACLLAAAASLAIGTGQAAAEKIRVLVITGGHGFERPQFFKVFEDNPEIAFTTAEHPDPKKGPATTDPAHDSLKPDAASQYDVIVLYDMWQKINDEQKADFLSVLKAGKGLVAMHHCLASYQDWPEYAAIIGGRYFLREREEGGVKKPRSTYKHDVRFKVQVADPQHPVTKGLGDFEIHDETYGGFEVRPDVRVLLTTDEPTSTKQICWAKTYGQSRVVYLQLGHDHLAYENPHYRRLIAQAIRWTAGR